MFSIKELKEKAVPVAKEFGIDELSLFGSYIVLKKRSQYFYFLHRVICKIANFTTQTRFVIICQY